jgi:hypothetical protein
MLQYCDFCEIAHVHGHENITFRVEKRRLLMINTQASLLLFVAAYLKLFNMFN